MKNVLFAFMTLSLFSVCCLSVNESSAEDNGEEVRVLTSLQATYSLASALAEGTDIKVVNVFLDGCRMREQAGWFKGHAWQFGKMAGEADAVVTIGAVWKSDPLYPYARIHNIRIVDIDSSQPFDPLMAGVSRLDVPEGSDVADTTAGRLRVGRRSNTSTYIWMSPSNGAKMAELIATDLKQLNPEDTEIIDKNLAVLKRRIFKLKSDYETKFAEVDDLAVLAMAPEFVYLTDNFNIYVVDYLFRQEIRWTDEDISRLKEEIVDNGIRVVINKWQPDKRIELAIEEAGAKTVVLNRMDPGLITDGKLDPDGYLKIMKENLQNLYEAFR